MQKATGTGYSLSSIGDDTQMNNRQPVITLHLKLAITLIETTRDNSIVNRQPAVMTGERSNLVPAVETANNRHLDFNRRSTNRNSKKLIGGHPSSTRSGKGSFRLVVEG
ncbi:hypothetical protein V6N13_048900 [Hibiscus sabdariffa]|uniref:Uncharacterized protein n=1 Tax=Hibiscus sabdariffa TaxID=183260 RepID=A0ABR2QZC8_9ROSI